MLIDKDMPSKTSTFFRDGILELRSNESPSCTRKSLVAHRALHARLPQTALSSDSKLGYAQTS